MGHCHGRSNAQEQVCLILDAAMENLREKDNMASFSEARENPVEQLRHAGGTSDPTLTMLALSMGEGEIWPSTGSSITFS
jgi:general stress protein 26